MYTIYCPRCDVAYKLGGPVYHKDKPVVVDTEKQLLDAMKKHVVHQHPDHDPEWWRDGW